VEQTSAYFYVGIQMKGGHTLTRRAYCYNMVNDMASFAERGHIYIYRVSMVDKSYIIHGGPILRWRIQKRGGHAVNNYTWRAFFV